MSVDTFLGLPFNIASYAELAFILQEITGYKALGIEGTLKCVHFYDNQYKAVKELLSRNPETHSNCELEIGLKYYDFGGWEAYINALKPSHFKLKGYTSDEAIKVKMLAPLKL
jgi:thymidylate synthase